jgi:hypothetical protein
MSSAEAAGTDSKEVDLVEALIHHYIVASVTSDKHKGSG